MTRVVVPMIDWLAVKRSIQPSPLISPAAKPKPLLGETLSDCHAAVLSRPEAPMDVKVGGVVALPPFTCTRSGLLLPLKNAQPISVV